MGSLSSGFGILRDIRLKNDRQAAQFKHTVLAGHNEFHWKNKPKGPCSM